jgi:hypothetical protein
MADQIHSTASELSVIVPEQWSARYYDVLLASLPFNSIISRDWEGEISNLGDRVKISTFPEFSAATELAEGAKGDADAVTVTQQSLIINNRTYKDFIVTNKAQLQSLPAMDKLRELAIYAIQKRIQAVIIAAISPSASSPDHQIAYDSGSTLGLADILEAKELLDAQDVPMSDRHVVLGAAQTNDIFNITGFTSSDFVLDGSPLTSGEVGRALLGFQPHMTTEVGAVAYFFHRSFMTMAAQQGVAVSIYDLGVEGKRAARVNVDTLWGLKQLDNKRVVSIS